MHSKLIVFLFCTCWVILANGPQHVEANFFDDIKSFFRCRNADEKRKKVTEKIFAKQVDEILTEIQSFGEKLVHQFEKQIPVHERARAAKEIDEFVSRLAKGLKNVESFYERSVEPVLDYTPIVGHLKCGIHLVMGDQDKADETLDKANTLPIQFVNFVAEAYKRVINFFKF